jgi:hypothetical protein
MSAFHHHAAGDGRHTLTTKAAERRWEGLALVIFLEPKTRRKQQGETGRAMPPALGAAEQGDDPTVSDRAQPLDAADAWSFWRKRTR